MLRRSDEVASASWLKTRRHVGMKQERVNAVIQSAKDAFGSTVLL